MISPRGLVFSVAMLMPQVAFAAAPAARPAPPAPPASLRQPLPVPIVWQARRPATVDKAEAPGTPKDAAQPPPAQPAAVPKEEPTAAAVSKHPPADTSSASRLEQASKNVSSDEAPVLPKRSEPETGNGTSLQRKYGGTSVAVGVGYGTVLDVSGMEGVSYGLTAALPLTRMLAIPLYLVVGDGSRDSFGAYQTGLRVGRTVFVDALVGWVRSKTGSTSSGTIGSNQSEPVIEASMGAGISGGVHIGLFGKEVRWGLLPQVYVGYPFSGDSPVIQGIVGLEARVTEP